MLSQLKHLICSGGKRIGAADFVTDVTQKFVGHRVVTDFSQRNAGDIESQRFAAVGEIGGFVRVHQRAGRGKTCFAQSGT